MKVTIRGIQSGFGQEDVSEITTTADYFCKADTHYIFYTEYTEEGQTLKNRLTIREDSVELKKTGNGDSLLKFRRGSKEKCHYQSPAGFLELMSDTKKIEFYPEKHSLKLVLDYSFYMTGMLMSDYHLTVEGEFLAAEEKTDMDGSPA